MKDYEDHKIHKFYCKNIQVYCCSNVGKITQTQEAVESDCSSLFMPYTKSQRALVVPFFAGLHTHVFL